MKCLGVFLLAAGTVMAADFATGQAARAVIGQPTFTAQLPDTTGLPAYYVNPFNVVLGGISGLAYANGTLFIADANRVSAGPINNRLLIFNDIASQVLAPDAEVPQGMRCPLCVGNASLVLGQADFETTDFHVTQNGLRLPTGVAGDGTRLAVADTDNNRVLIWNSIPTQNQQPADVVVGQPDFQGNAPNNSGTGTADVRVPNAKSLRGPQGVWLQNGKLFVADDQNHRVLIWNSIPTSNFAAADIVLGQPDFSKAIEPDLTKTIIDAQANTLLNPVAVTSDGVRLFVTDLGHNRVLIWNTIPTQNQQPADIVIGQPNMTTAIANYSGDGGMCASNGTDSDGNATYPELCGATLNYPRFALSDGSRLFIADGGNDRVLIFNQIPTQNGAAADVVLGQNSDTLEQTSDNPDNPDSARQSSSDSIRTPMSLAWDGANLYVSDPFSRRVLVFSVGAPVLPLTAVRNAASLDVFAVGSVAFSGTITADDEVTITIQGKDYKYKILKDDTFDIVVNKFVALINAGDGDPYALATPNLALSTVVLTSRLGGAAGNSTTLTTTVSTNATIVATASGANLAGGGDAAKIAPGTLVTIFGDNLAESSASAPTTSDPLPTELAGVQVYIDGIRAPLLAVSPTQINAQIPFEVLDSTSTSAYVRTKRADGVVTSTTAIGVPIIPSNPGIFAQSGPDPRPGVVLHGSSQAAATVIIEGSAKTADIATVTIEDRSYSYTVQDGDTLYSIRDNLVAQINAGDPKVYAMPSGQWSYIRLRARVEGPEGEGIPFSASGNEGGNLVMQGSNTTLCCANVAFAPVTDDNPAVPGETIIVYATGLGMVGPDEAKFQVATGFTYKGPVLNLPGESVSSLAGGKSAGVYYAGLKQGTVGLYEVDLELNADLPTNPAMQCTIAQDVYVSNIVTFPIRNPNQ